MTKSKSQSRRHLSRPYLCYLMIMRFSWVSSPVLCFTVPMKDSMMEKRKCHGGPCRRRGYRSSSSQPSNNQYIEKEVGVLHESTHSDHSFEERMAAHQMIEEADDPLDNISEEDNILRRRSFLKGFLAATAIETVLPSQKASAYERAYPLTLEYNNDENIQSIREGRIASKKSQIKSKDDIIKKPLKFSQKDAIGSVVWGAALWLLSGSRSNPIVKPLGNILYDQDTEDGAWLKDRNEGLFTPLPATFMLLLGVLFLVLGFVTERSLLYVAEGESNVVLQLAGVSFIGGGALELGRIASGEKMQTREDSDRDDELQSEFEEFASKKLIIGKGGSVHRSEIIRSFRRYFAKYRVENDDYPLSDLEIERLIRDWNSSMGNMEGMSSAGFVKGVQLNAQAEIR